MDAHQAPLDARVAEAAEAWLTDPGDVAAYGRLVAAVEQRRRWLDGAGRSGSSTDHVDASVDSDDEPPDGEASDDDLERSWPTVRAVGADLAGDPVAVLRRLRGG